MKCPICGGMVFIEKKFDKKLKAINFETRTILDDKSNSRQKFYYCASAGCGYKLWGNEVTQIRKEMKYLKDVE